MHIKRRVISSLLAMFSLFAFSLTTKSQRPPNITFPSQSKAASPNGRYVVVGVDSPEEPHHTIFLEDRRLQTRRKLLNYERSADILWNPNSKSLALTDHGGSDFSLCSVIAVDPAAPSIQVMDEA